MFSQTFCLTGLAIVLAVAISFGEETTQPMQGPIDVQQLRAQTLRIHDFEEPTVVRSEKMDPRWGIAFGEIPELMYQHCPALKGQTGLLVDRVCGGSLAAEIGLKPNQILLQVGDQILLDPSDMPTPSPDAPILLMDHGKLYTATVPAQIKRRMDQAFPILETRESAERRMFSADLNVASIASTASATSVADGSQQSISIAEANGRYKIAIQMPSETGPQAFRIKGTRVEVERQLDRLPKAVRRAVRSQLPTANR